MRRLGILHGLGVWSTGFRPALQQLDSLRMIDTAAREFEGTHSTQEPRLWLWLWLSGLPSEPSFSN